METPGPAEDRACGFVEDGRRYVLRDVHLIDRADADLWNDRMCLQIDHRGRCDAWFLQPSQTRYSEPLRCFYIRDDATGEFWSAPFEPVQAEPDEFEFSAGLADLRWRVARDGIQVRLRLVVPRDDTVELWSAEVRNLGNQRRRVSLYSLIPVGSVGPLGHQAEYDRRLGGMIHQYFPYYVRWQDYDDLRKLKNCTVCLTDREPTAFEVNLDDFRGGRGLHNPAGLALRRLAGGRACHEPSAAVFQYSWQLSGGSGQEVNLVFGPVSDRRDASRLKRKYLGQSSVGQASSLPGRLEACSTKNPAPLGGAGITRALRKVESFLAAHAADVRVETPDEQLNHYVNHWQPRRALLIGKTARLTFCPQGRNVIQDAMGAVYTNPTDSRDWFLRAYAHQKGDGWLPHGMPMHKDVNMMPIGAIPHRDTTTWGATAIQFYVSETGDFDILDEPVPFADGSSEAPFYEHVCRGIDWSLKDRTPRGLSRLGQGDWNDPLNMAGKEGRGESVWLTQALAVALDTWALVAEWRGDMRRSRRYGKEADACREAINRYAWDGRWYARGTTDEGRWFGVAAERQGRIFLNAQSWAILSGAATGDRLDACIAAVDQHLATPAGPMTLAPPYTRMREDIGKLTQKPPGTGENGSVYCHAVTFYAYALYQARRSDEAYRVLRNLLPDTRDNPISRAGQLPLYIPNYYRGTACGASAGRSSHSPNSGTSAWFYRTVIAMLLGVRGELGGLRIDPQLPSAWHQARVWRRWRGAEFDVEIRRRRTMDGVAVTLDGEPLTDHLVPPQPSGSKHAVVVTVAN